VQDAARPRPLTPLASGTDVAPQDPAFGGPPAPPPMGAEIVPALTALGGRKPDGAALTGSPESDELFPLSASKSSAQQPVSNAFCNQPATPAAHRRLITTDEFLFFQVPRSNIANKMPVNFDKMIRLEIFTRVLTRNNPCQVRLSKPENPVSSTQSIEPF